jgi:biopolymer transport protein ExbB
MIQEIINQQFLNPDAVLNITNQLFNSNLPANGSVVIFLSVSDLAFKAGPILIPILLLSILALYIFIERFVMINRAMKEDPDFMDTIRDFMINGRSDSALALCRTKNSPYARMIEKGLLRKGLPLADINSAIENVGTIEVAKLEKNISLLATVSGAAPMLGFLGTVIGMVKVFNDMAVANNNIDIPLLSGGIYQALSATIAGLIVGISAYFCYNILVARVQKLVYKLQLRANEFMDLLHETSK